MVHELKCLEPFLEAIWVGHKTAELRRDDREFRLGDMVILREWSVERRWGTRFVVVEVTHIYGPQDDSLELLPPGVVLLSFGIHEKGIGNPRTVQKPEGNGASPAI